jgi:hypothetical protein
MTKRPLFAAVGLACLLAGCTTTGVSVNDPPSPQVQTYGGYDVSHTIPPATRVRVEGPAALSNGRAVLTPTANPGAVCARIDHGGCVVRSGNGFIVYIDARLPEWVSDLYSAALLGHVGQMILGLAYSETGYTDPTVRALQRMGAGTAAGGRAAPVLTYANVWGGEAPEPYYSTGQRMLANGTAVPRYMPLSWVENVCGRNHDQTGWVQMACQIEDNGRAILVIANDVPMSARANIEAHEAAHAAGWPADHPGAMKPTGHLDACIRSMNEAGLTLRQMRDLCYLDGGAPLRTQAERDRLAAMR